MTRRQEVRRKRCGWVNDCGKIARAVREGEHIRAQVTSEVVEEGSLFGALGREWNGLKIVAASGRAHRVTGRGAGRWPTTEAAMQKTFSISIVCLSNSH